MFFNFFCFIIVGSSTAELQAPESKEQLPARESEDQLPALTFTDTLVSTSAGMTGQFLFCVGLIYCKISCVLL